MENNQIKICEIFDSIQGEGKYAGTPMIFVRTSGCTRQCSFCDTQYHNEGSSMSLEEIEDRLNKSKIEYVCWTGGEPLIYKEQIRTLKRLMPNKIFHLETNADLLTIEDRDIFSYIATSPKELKVAKNVWEMVPNAYMGNILDVKIVTDLETVGKDMVRFATILMPLTTYDIEEDTRIRQKVWNYCVENNIKFTPRFHIWIWGKKKGI